MVPKNKNPETKKYIGHLIFPYDPKIIDIFFKPPGKKTVYLLKYKGKVINQSGFNAEFVKFLKSIGYEYTSVKIDDARRRPRNTFEGIPVTPVIEYDDVKLTEAAEIIVGYPAKTLQEVTKRGEILLRRVNEITGILGDGDIYGKMELC